MCRLLAKHFCCGEPVFSFQEAGVWLVTHLTQLWLSQVSNESSQGGHKGKTPHLPLKMLHVCVLAGALGPVCTGPGALQVQRGEHDGLSAAQHRQPARVVRGGEVVDGAAAGAPQARDGAPGWHDDSK